MKKTFLISVLLLLSVVFITPVIVGAQGTPPNPGGDPPSVVIKNPLKIDSIPDLIFTFVEVATTIGFYIAVFFIIYSGFLFVTARGNETKLGKAKEAFLWTVIGTAVLLGARVIANVIQGTLNEIKAEVPQHEIFRV